MDERQLLELAAKAAIAAGMPIIDSAAGPQILADTARNGDEFYRVWNPLHDDGDALRLAVKLELEFYYGDDEDGTSVHVGYARDPNSVSMISYCIEQIRDDPCAATRRAIVRAAAEIGKEQSNEK